MKLRLPGVSLLALIWLVACLVALAPSAGAQGLADDDGASWRLDQPLPPPPPPGVAPAPAPVGLGRIGDIEFAPGMPNRGALITAGNIPTVPAGVWEFNGVSWHELATVCGASNGRIIWAGPEEFWTISDGRTGQAAGPRGEPAPLRDNTLCRFSNPGHKGEPLRVMESFAFPAFEADSYQEVNAGACFNASDCWFAGNPLPRGSSESGSFHLHWNGQSLSEEPYPAEGFPVESMQEFEGRLYEGVRIGADDRDESKAEPAPLHTIAPEGSAPLFTAIPNLPLYAPEEAQTALEFLHLSAGEELLWAAAGPQEESEKPAPVSIMRKSSGGWRQIVGPPASAEEPFAGKTPATIAAEPGTENAWIALDSPEDYAKATSPLNEQPSFEAPAIVARLAANGAVSDEEDLTQPGSDEGAAYTMSCPAVHDCWLATTHGWLFHLDTEQEQSEQEAGTRRDPDGAFETLIAERPEDQGLPVPPPVSLPPDDSGLLGELTVAPPPLEQRSHTEESRVTLPLLSAIKSRLHGDTLELRFHLEVKARLKLLAKRGKRLVASTPMRTFAAGSRSLSLRLDPKHWPTKLQLQSHALAPLPTVSLNKSNETSVSTSLRFPNLRALGSPGLLQ